MATLTIRDIHCRRRSESTGWDNIYLRVRGSKIWPDGDYYNIDVNQSVQVYRAIGFGGDVTVELMEYDSSSPDDLLGSITVNEQSRGVQRGEANGDGGAYDIYFEVTG